MPASSLKYLSWSLFMLGFVAFTACGSSSPSSSGSGGNGGSAGSITNGSSGERSIVCVPGQQVACACADGTQGAQACNGDGSGYLACACAAGTSGAGDVGTGGNAGASGDASAAGAAGDGDGALGSVGGNTGGSGAGGSSGMSSAGGGAGGPSGQGGGGSSVCGNGSVEASEGCDDGNRTAGDGCSAACTIETGFACNGSPSACNRSCNGLARTCGPSGDADCCASGRVTGGTFWRSYDGTSANYTDQYYSATVSDFRLDTYEITVGRFRKFVAAYSPTNIAAGSGANPNNASDTGWDSTWSTSLETNATTLTSAVECDPTYQTWTAGNDSLPINCLDWYEAEAFCVWDGGRLPTEAEWNYAAAGGAEQRVYPWGNTALGANADLAVYGCYYGGTGSCSGATNIARVGSISAGNGKWGQADLAGNVWEWVQDWYADSYYRADPCDDCADLTSASNRALRGGDFAVPAAIVLLSSHRNSDTPNARQPYFGARCARSAP